MRKPRVYRDAKVTTEPAALLTSGEHAARSIIQAARLQCATRSALGCAVARLLAQASTLASAMRPRGRGGLDQERTRKSLLDRLAWGVVFVRCRVAFVLVLLVGTIVTFSTPQVAKADATTIRYPPTPRASAVNTYFGTLVPDPYHCGNGGEKLTLFRR